MTSKWSLVAYIIGFGLSISGIVRYYIIYPDMDRAIVFGLIGLFIMGFAYIYNSLLNLNNKLYAIEEYLSDREALKGGEENGEIEI